MFLFFPMVDQSKKFISIAILIFGRLIIFWKGFGTLLFSTVQAKVSKPMHAKPHGMIDVFD